MSEATETEFLQDWFAKHGLPCSDKISKKLFDLGVECVEELKFLPAEVFMDLFCCEKFIVKEKAKLARQRLSQEGFNFKKCTMNPPLKNEECYVTPQKKKKSYSSHAIRQHNNPRNLEKFIKITVIKTKEQKQEEREERKRQQMCTALVGTSDAVNTGPVIEDGVEVLADDTQQSTAAVGASSLLLQLLPADFRAGRCSHAANLLPPAGRNEKVCWTEGGLLSKEESVFDLEDVAGHYQLLCCDKSSSDADVAHAFAKSRQSYHRLGVTHHPDKTPDTKKRAIFAKAKDSFEQQKIAMEVLGTKDDDGMFHARFLYDLQGEALRAKFKASFHKRYEVTMTFASRAMTIEIENKRAEIFTKGARTKVGNVHMPIIDKIVRCWQKKGSRQMLLGFLLLQLSRMIWPNLNLLESFETSYSARQIRGMGGHVKTRSSTESTVLLDVSRLLGRKVNFNLLLILFVLLSVLRRQ